MHDLLRHTGSTWLVALALLATGFAPPVHANFAVQFQEAKQQFDQRNYDAARAGFVALAESAPNAHGKAAALSFAARALGLTGQYDDALALAETIDLQPMAAHTKMTIMLGAKKYQQLVDAFKDASPADWPDHINYSGLLMRGTAYFRLRQYEPAAADLAAAVDLAGSDSFTKLEALNFLAGSQAAIGDNEAALQAYQQAFDLCDANPKLKGKYLFPQAVLGTAAALMRQGKLEEARTTLNRFEIESNAEKRSSWDFRVLEAHGDLLLKEGKPDQALSRYREALAIDTHDSYIARVQAKVEKLQSE